MKKPRLLKAKLLLGLVSLIGLYAIVFLRVDNELDASDISAITQLNLESVCGGELNSFDSELDCLKGIQSTIHAIGQHHCAAKGELIEPAEFLKRKYGCCFDRARFFEKSARFYGFESRHVFLIVPKYSSLFNILPLGQSSHATSEVLTKRGWLGIDSNALFLLTDQQGVPHPYRSLKEHSEFRERATPTNFYAQPYDVIYGLYSRHGFFHGWNLPGPEFVFDEFMYNF